MVTAAVILAAGTGERLGGETPKAFIELEGATILQRAVVAAAASDAVDRLVVAVPEGWVERVDADTAKPVEVIVGGTTRQESVMRSIAAVGDADSVLVHDAARCLASSQLFDRVAAALEGEGVDGVVPGVPVRDTIKRVRDGIVVGTVERDELVRAQTPQGFRTEVLRAVHEEAAAEGRSFTDDAGMLERSGRDVVAVAGEESNFKITTADDLARARRFLGDAR